MHIGTNLFGIGKYIADDPAIAAQQIKAAGFSSVEPMLMFFSKLPQQVQAMGKERVRMGLGKQKNSIWMDDEAAHYIELYRSAGLEVVSAQIFGFANKMIPDAVLAEALVQLGKENGISHFVVSGKAASIEGAEKIVPSMNTIAKVLKENGMQFVYHNHEMEVQRHNEMTALEYIMDHCPDMGLELDVGWVQFAGEYPVNWIKKYQDRMVLLHLKDICEGASEENKATCYRAIGEGCIQLDAIMRAAQDCPIIEYGIIIDQDDANTDFFEESRRGIANITVNRKE